MDQGGGARMDFKSGIILDMLPVPPSENQSYATDWKTGRRFPSQELKEYKLRCLRWSLQRSVELKKIIDALKWELADHRKALRVDSYFFLQYETLFTKPTSAKDRPRRKKVDIQNFGKALFDCLAAMLGVDDSRFIPGEMVPIHRLAPTGQYVQLKLTLAMIQTDAEFTGWKTSSSGPDEVTIDADLVEKI